MAIILYAFEKEEIYKLTAEDKDTDIRTGKYLLDMIINKISGLKEISNGRNAALLINLKRRWLHDLFNQIELILFYQKWLICFVQDLKNNGYCCSFTDLLS